MHSPADSADFSRQALAAALLDYAQSPGKYQVRLRQPPPLFAALREVLQIAVGRDGEAAVGGAQQAALLRDAARFFTRTALLYPGADHYAVLGLERNAESADLKDRYRLLMRLLHPDFAGPDAGAWPSDAAVRVNRAYDVLSSPVQRREFDERTAQAPNIPQVQPVAARRPGLVPRVPDADSRQSRFKKLAVACALAGGALVLVSLFGTGSSDTAHLVQRTRVETEPVRMAALAPAPAVKSTAPPVHLQMQAQMLPTPAAPQARPVEQQVRVRQPTVATEKRVEETRPPAIAVPARPALPAPVATAPVVSSPPSPPEPRAAAVPSAAISVVATPAPQAPLPLLAASLPPATAAPAPRPPLKAGPTLMEAQPLLSQLLQLMESGRGERILNLLDADARSRPAAQALSRQYDSLVDGARPVRLSHVEFKAEPGDGRLLVVGHLRVLAGEQTIGSLGKKMVLRAEFASREGNVVITGLSGGPVN